MDPANFDETEDEITQDDSEEEEGDAEMGEIIGEEQEDSHKKEDL
jgi:hypothetical protein